MVFSVVPWRPGGGTPGNSWWGCAARFSKSWPYFRPKNVIFHTRFQMVSIPPFGPGGGHKTQPYMFKYFEFTLVPIPDSRPKWAHSTSVLRPKRCKSTTLCGGTYLYGLCKGVPPPPPPHPPGLKKAALPKRRLRLFWIASILQFSNSHQVTTLHRDFNLYCATE